MTPAISAMARGLLSARVARHSSLAVGAALLLFLHLFRLSSVPGLHYDEAWAMNFAWRLASEKGFWPLTAMSPYTAPWAHYWAAGWMALFGPSVLVFRASQAALSLLGLLLLGLALPRHLRAFFPWVVLLLPGLLLNHRFAIELNGLHALAFGMFCLALRRGWPRLAAAAALVGTTAHILFYAVALATLGVVLLERSELSRRERWSAMAYFSLIAAFFAKVLAEVPEKGKAGALLLSAIGALALLLGKADRRGSSFWRWRGWDGLAAAASLVFLFNALVFAHGFWSLAVSTGFGLLLPLEGLLAALGFAALLFLAARAFLTAPRRFKRGFGLLTLFLGLMMLKPAPRYFETGMLALSALLCLSLGGWATARPRKRRVRGGLLLACFLAINPGLVVPLYFLFPTVESSLRFLFFKDSSRDFLDKQGIVRFLGGSGCSLGDIHSNDPRLMECLRAISLGDWPVDSSEPCSWNFISRRAELGGVGEAFGEFVLRRKR